MQAGSASETSARRFVPVYRSLKVEQVLMKGVSVIFGRRVFCGVNTTLSYGSRRATVLLLFDFGVFFSALSPKTPLLWVAFSGRVVWRDQTGRSSFTRNVKRSIYFFTSQRSSPHTAETPLYAPLPVTQSGAALRMAVTPVRGPPRRLGTLSEKGFRLNNRNARMAPIGMLRK